MVRAHEGPLIIYFTLKTLHMKKLLLLLFIFPIFGISQDKVKFTATGVTCSMCSNAIYKSLSLDKTISKIDPNLETQEWNLEYKKGEFEFQTLVKRVEDAGFGVGKVYLNGELILDNSKKKKIKNHKH